MATPRKPVRRPVSRTPTTRPRTVAGRREDPPAAVTHEEPPAPPVDAPAADETGNAAATPEPDGEAAPSSSPRSSGPRATVSLVVALVLLVGVAAFEGWYLWGQEEPVVSASRPVVIGEVAHRSAVETARTNVEDILTYGYQDFDTQVEDAAKLMTPAFVEEFQVTAGDVRERFLRQRIEQEVRVVAASVVQASPEQVQTLLFLQQYVIRPSSGTSLHSYRALVTLARDEGGWLISNIETR